MTSHKDLFDRAFREAIDARDAGRWDIAADRLKEAARQKLMLARQSDNESLRAERLRDVQKLNDTAKLWAQYHGENRPAQRATPGTAPGASGPTRGSAQRQEEDEGKSGSDFIVREKPNIKFDDVAGLEIVKEDIRLKMLYPFEFPELAEQFGVKPGGGVLMYGPPGTGKTMMARATAGELEATFFTVTPGDILSKWFGEAEANIKKLFDAAAAEPRAIIFIDEIEALIPARGNDSAGGAMQRVIPQILQGMEGFGKRQGQPVLFMGATNVPWQLDPAVLRPGRFDEKVYIPLPDQPARRKMLEIYLKGRPITDEVDLDRLAVDLEGYSGADIKYICDTLARQRFMQSMGRGGEVVPIDMQAVREVLSSRRPSVTAEQVRRFEQWAATGH